MHPKIHTKFSSASYLVLSEIKLAALIDVALHHLLQLDDEEDVRRRVGDVKDAAFAQGAEVDERHVGAQHALQLLGVHIEVEVLRDFLLSAGVIERHGGEDGFDGHLKSEGPERDRC